MFCEARDGLSQVGGVCASGVRGCCVGWGRASGPSASHLAGGYPKIPLLQFAVMSGALWDHEERLT